jgi:hypothetical protein
MECPKCKLINLESAEVCDCGYSFAAGSKVTRATKAQVKSSRGANLGLVLAGRILVAGFAVLMAALLMKHWGW